jgi:hypothetical protein
MHMYLDAFHCVGSLISLYLVHIEISIRSYTSEWREYPCSNIMSSGKKLFQKCATEFDLLILTLIDFKCSVHCTHLLT